ncbi:ABC transporter ATP-binding protein [Facklamia sp. HMSC062C11]|uniref:ABC transporter ATP-binding protein n=1 Tax=Facklamia sp. HMSC062C11 TaxID=1739262 RepID=UPI0008A11654|nr:ABC transporter ATP-binding protein [Facklamia sp. HMSC062C11]OFL67551.1 ABC transporter ATP-binding protein [Facklamia sp. HMSC062C11]
MLQVTDLQVSYGMIKAIKEVSFEVKEGSIVTLIGANGAGKSTILRSLSGLIKAQAGQITYLGQDLMKKSAQEIVKAGLVQVPEGRRIFPGLSVAENLEMGAFLRKDRSAIQADLEAVYQRFPILKERNKQDAATLSGGEQQMLAMGRALMTKPKLLLLDEPSMGLAPIFINEIFNIIQDINDQGTTILLVEQNAYKALEIADQAYVLESGQIVLSGSGQELLASDAVQKAYLGG